MRTHKRIWLACLLAAAMLLSIVPMTAFAAGDAVTDEAGLRAAVAGGGEITLGADITISEAITVDKDLTINFDGHKIALPAGMNYTAEAAFIVSGADLTLNGTTSWSSGIGYAGSGSLFKLVGVVGEDTTVTVNGGGYSAYENWDRNVGGLVYPASLIAFVTGADAVQPKVVFNDGSFSSAAYDDALGYARPAGPLVSGDAGSLTITGGTYCIDPQAYVAAGGMCFEQSWGDEWQVLTVSEQMSEEFRSILNDEGVFVFNRYEPTNEEDMFYLYDALRMQFYDEEEGQRFTVYDATYDAEEKTMYFSMLDPETGAILETHNIPLAFVYDPALKAEVDKLIADIPEGEDMGEWIEPYYFAVNDLELVNYWLTCSDEIDNINLLINYSSDFKKFIGYKNFRLDARKGDGDFFYTSVAGIADFSYNGTVYGIKEFGARAEHILYVAEDATDVVAAAQKRLDDYLGEGKVVLESCGTVGDVEPQHGVESLLLTDVCVKTEINGMTYWMAIKQDDDKLVAPTYQNVDVNTEIEVSSDDSSIPLDTMLEIEHLTSGAEYDRIQSVLNAEESESYDIKLHSGSLDKYVTKLENGQFEVKIPVPEKLEGKDLIVYYVDANGKVTPHAVTPEGDYATFVTDHFSVYTLAAAAPTSGHGHAYPDKWESDKDNHWHACACGAKADVAAHTYKGGKCTVCGVAGSTQSSGGVGEAESDSPNTGDTANVAIALVLMLIGGAVVALTARRKETVK